MLDIVCAGQAAMDRQRKLNVVHIDFSVVCDRVSYSGLLYKLNDVSVGVAAFDVIAGFLSGRVERVVVVDVRSENAMMVSDVPKGSVLGQLHFFAVHQYLQQLVIFIG